MTVSEKIRQFELEGYKVIHNGIRIRTIERDFVTGDRYNGYGTHFTKI